jgi:DNA-binding CsgD family transcriptional regulator
MGLFDIFKKKKKVKTRKKRQRKSSIPKTKEDIIKLSSDIKNLQSQIGTIDIVLHKHDDDITEHSILIARHSRNLEKLEQLVAKQPINPPKFDSFPASRPIATINPQPLSQTIPLQQAQKFSVNRFSPQEKRILSVFFQNTGMTLSYIDIAHSLNKSPNTIKNQMRQINIKADLFTESINEENRKRFKLKDGLKIEKYLNVD